MAVPFAEATAYRFEAAAAPAPESGSRTDMRVPEPLGLSMRSSHTVRDPDQTVTVGVGPADADVPNVHVQRAVLHPSGHLGVAGVRVLHDVGQRLGHDEVRARLDVGGKPRGRKIDLHGQVAIRRTMPAAQLCRLAPGLVRREVEDPQRHRLVALTGEQRACRFDFFLSGGVKSLERDVGVSNDVDRATIQRGVEGDYRINSSLGGRPSSLERNFGEDAGGRVTGSAEPPGSGAA